jgi:hypothetical protein
MIALQMLSSLYYGVFFVTFVAAVWLTLWLAGQAPLAVVARPLIGGALVASVLVVPVTVPYWLNREVVGERDTGEVESYSAVPADYLAPHARSVYRGWGTETTGERELFPGLAPVVLAAVALWPPLTPLRLAYAVGLVFAFDASLGFNGEAYHWFYDYVPGAHAFRAPARFGAIVAVALSVLGGCAMARLLSGLPSRRARAACVAVVAAVILVESRPVLALDPIWPHPPRVYGAMPPSAVLVEFPFPQHEGAFWHEARYLYFSTFHWHRLINGNSGFFPEDYRALVEQLRAFPDERTLQVLRDRGADFIVLHGGFEHRPEYDRLVGVLSARPDVTLVATDRWIEGEVRLYRLRR